MLRGKLLVAGAAAAVLVVVGGIAYVSDNRAPRHPVPASPGTFDIEEVTWAKGSTIHYGDQTFDVGPEVVRGMLLTQHGFFLTLAPSMTADLRQHEVFFDGTDLTELPGDVRGPMVSPDGAYAGWMDYDGPWRPAGRIAQVVVVDLATGSTVFEDHDHMGGGFGDDLRARYGELPPRFVGFDDENRAHWHDGEGSSTRWRVDLGTGEKQKSPVPFDEPSGAGAVVEGPYNPRLGTMVGIQDGRPAGALMNGEETGILSPSGDYVLVTNYTGRLPTYQASDGTPIRFDHGRRSESFGGWQGPSRLYLMVSDRRDFSYDPYVPDRRPSTLVSCALPSGHCTEIEQIRGSWSVAFGTGLVAQQAF